MASEIDALCFAKADSASTFGTAEAECGRKWAAPSVSGSDATRLIRDLAQQQHGVVARRQLLSVGLGAALLDQRVNSGALVVVHRGVYAIGPRRWDLRERCMAAVLACGDGAVLSHESASRIWGIRRSRRPVEVTRESGGTQRGGILLHQSRLPASQVTAEAAIPITTIERTLLDIAPRLGRRQMERALVEADRSGRLRWDELGRAIEGGKGRPGVGLLRAVAADADPRAREVRSPTEIDFLALCREAGLPAPAVNVLVEGCLVDFLWPAERVIVETDSYTYHGDRLAYERDSRRTAALTLAGYDVQRVTAAMLEDAPGQVIALVRRSLKCSA